MESPWSPGFGGVRVPCIVTSVKKLRTNDSVTHAGRSSSPRGRKMVVTNGWDGAVRGEQLQESFKHLGRSPKSWVALTTLFRVFRGLLPHYGNWGSPMWTMIPATFQSKCLHLIALPMVVYHTTVSLAPHKERKFRTFRGKTNGSSSWGSTRLFEATLFLSPACVVPIRAAAVAPNQSRPPPKFDCM